MDEIIKKLHKHYPDFCGSIGFFGSTIKGLDAQLVWQFVRRSQRYKGMYQFLARNYDDIEEVLFCSFMGISTPIDYEQDRLPPGCYFHQSLVKDFDIRKFMKDGKYQSRIEKYLTGFVTHDFKYFSAPDDDPMYAFVVNLKDDPNSIAKMVKLSLTEKRNQLKKHRIDLGDEFQNIKASTKRKTLFNWLLSYHLKVEKELSHNDVRKEYESLKMKPPGNKEINEHIKQFLAFAENTPIQETQTRLCHHPDGTRQTIWL